MKTGRRMALLCMAAWTVAATFVCMQPLRLTSVGRLCVQLLTKPLTHMDTYPLCLRADMAFEATFVGQRMLDERGPGSFITGPSTANQVSIFQAAYLAVHDKGILNITSCRLAELLRCSQSCSRCCKLVCSVLHQHIIALNRSDVLCTALQRIDNF